MNGRGHNSGDLASLSKGSLVRLPGEIEFVRVAMVDDSGPMVSIMVGEPGAFRQVVLDAAAVAKVEALTADGQAESVEVLAGLWAEWMGSSAANTEGAAMIASTLTPYPHQHQAVYQRMLPQPLLRFLLADEPGTGKTIMGGLYAREAQRLGIVNRCLVVCPAHLVTKWQADFERFLGGGLRRIDATTVAQQALRDGLHAGDGFWVVSLELAAMNPAVLEAIHPDTAGWDLVIFDEAHRLTPTADTFHRVGRVLAEAPRALLMTATPHRGNEWLFRSLMHLVDPDVFPAEEEGAEHDHELRPGATHFLRRMKEELRDHNDELLFKARIAHNVKAPLSSVEYPFYEQALALVDAYFPPDAKTLGRMVYGKRAASSLYALAETLRRRIEGMGTKAAPEAERDVEVGDPFGDDLEARDHAKVIFAGSTSSREERTALKELHGQIDDHITDPDHSGPADRSSKWSKMVDQCLTPNNILPANDHQLVVFTEYADTADWLVEQFAETGYSARRYSGRDTHATRDLVRDEFMAGEFQIIVSTDAGNEGIDLQSAQVLVNWDIPWSLVTLEQRMGRIHRVGQKHDVHLYNLITTGTLEGETYFKLLERLVVAANDMEGKMFDCLSLVGEQMFNGATTVPLAALYDKALPAQRAADAIEAITEERLRQAAITEIEREKSLAAGVEMDEAIRALQDQQLEQINPYIVDRYLQRIKDAGLVDVSPNPLADYGLFNLAGTPRFKLPRQLKDPDSLDDSTLVATLGKAKTDAVKAGNHRASSAVDLSPSTDPFNRLVDSTVKFLRPAIFRGGVLKDETTTTDYTLFSFETPVTEGTRRSRWRQLIRVDATGAHPVRFDILNNLVALPGQTHVGGYHPGRHHTAVEAAIAAVASRRSERERLLDVWHTKASQDLKKLPFDLTRDIVDADTRAAVRARAKKAAVERANVLKTASDLKVEQPALVGWAYVTGQGIPEQPEEKDSETISMVHVTKLLNSAGWDVADVSQEMVGYDLRARRGLRHRAIEVKGIWTSASSTGIRLTGDEMIRAGILGDDYWLYVVDGCEDGTGTLRTVIRNPADELADLTRDVAVLAVKGSALMAAKQSDPT